MKYKLFNYLFLLVICAFTGLTYSQVPGNEPVMQTKVYKTIGLTKVKMYIYQASDRDDLKQRPAIVFFGGGGLSERHIGQFMPQCKYLAKLGMVAMVADYRIIRRPGVTPFDCITDAKSAIRWVRAHAGELGIDENRIAAGGGSAGGYLAACTGFIKDFDEKKEDLKISSIPNALILFNPLVDMPEQMAIASKKVVRTVKDRATEISPINHVNEGAPPTIIFQGTADKSVNFHQSTRFCEEMKKYGNDCEVVLYEGRDHGFFLYFLYPEKENPDFISTMEYTVKFLTSLGYIKGETTISK